MLYRWKKIDYTVPSGHEGGPGMGKQITPYVGTPYINMTAAQFAAVHQNIGACLGDTWTLGGGAPALGGNTFQFVRAVEALALGDVVTAAWPAGTVGANAIFGDQDVITATVPGVPVTTTAAVTTDYNNVGIVAANGDIDNWIFVHATGATLPQLRRIKAHTVSATANYTVALRDFMRPSSPTDTDVFDTIATNTNPVVIIRPYNVMLNGLAGAATGTTPMGIALGTVTAGNYTIIQLAGLASVNAIGDGTALAANVQAVPSDANRGVIIGSGGTANLWAGSSQIIPQQAYAAAAPAGLVPCYVNFLYQ